MIIVLDVEKGIQTGIKGKLRALLHPYEISTRVKKQNKVTVLYIRYRSNRGGIRFKKLYEYSIGAPKTVLCSKGISLENTPFKRFESNELRKLLMRNFVLELLRSPGVLTSSLKIGYYDPMAENPMFAESLLHEVRQLTVVSSMPRFYERESDRLTELIGVPLTVSNSPESLSDCDIVICPETVEQHLPLSEKTLLFTASRPAVSLKCTVISEYFPEFPYRYKRLKTKCVDDVYFLSALYSMCGVKELANLIPEKCGDGSTLYSTERLAQRLRLLKAPEELLKAE